MSELKSAYSNINTLKPFYAPGGGIASISSNGEFLAASVLDQVNILQIDINQTDRSIKLYESIENEDEQEITCLQVTPDGSKLCFVNQAQLITIFDIKQSKIVKNFKVSSPSYVMACDELTSNILAIGGTDGSITIYDLNNGYITHSLKGHGGTISSLKIYGELDSEHWFLLSGDTNGVIKVWDLIKSKCLHTMNEHTSAIRGLDMTANKDSNGINTTSWKLISGGRDNVINHFTFTRRKYKLELTIPVHQQIEACGYLANPEYCYAAGGEAIFQIFDSKTGKVVKKTVKPLEELFIVGVLPINSKKDFYLVLSDQSLFRLVDLDDEYFMTKNEEDNEILIDWKIAGNHGTIADMKLVGPKLNKLALATNSPTLRIIPTPPLSSSDNESIIKLDNLYEVEMYEGHSDLLNTLDCTEDGQWIATASKDSSAILWKYDEEYEIFKQYARFEGHAGSVTAIGLPNAVTSGAVPSFLITASNDLTIKKWKIPLSKEDEIIVIKNSEYTRKAHDKDINALDISPNDSIFATASYDKTCKIWNIDDGELVASLSNHKRGLWDVKFCQYDKILATCSGDKTIKLWSLDNYTVMKTLEGHTNAVQRCEFINKNKQVVSSGADGLVKIWDLAEGECLKTLDGHSNRIWSLCVKNDGEEIISADADGVFQFWKDNSIEEELRNLEEEKLKIEQEQSLTNYLRTGDWVNAFLLAMRLDHPMRLYNVLNQCLISANDSDDEYIFNKDVDAVISTLDKDQLITLMKRCRDWNTNARTHLVATKVIKCIIKTHNINKLSELPNMMKLINSIIPYTQRHYTRMDNLVEQSYILDYALIEMDRLL
ncbi:probable U3 small nucleolar RNA-associated protein 13 [Saccharomycodes ludwigii]|uniref:Probable U3 small nucleolar RNA-associated protein 13 n=1 Tax=Saccharomycodes ludwigii TaxID=36035 RepID=A0A376B6F6_9ASCO|nr:hypothetical protein SCDLUD_001907 [Saccharomycodes ludwigii]KAH3902094.1 hypothetical protein SCDLUD_001907 [Saccharomycodes ludwigii]SSD60221.1 probable U3 small nucleolar RNA-associated protein 13 [Saccharomycodes ludwigii]